jgi:hypothetical protein
MKRGISSKSASFVITAVSKISHASFLLGLNLFTIMAQSTTPVAPIALPVCGGATVTL